MSVLRVGVPMGPGPGPVPPPGTLNPDGTRGLEPRDGQPRYIRHCYNGTYTLRLVEKATAAVSHVRVACCSWRHEGPCQAMRFVRDRDKITHGLRDTDIDDILFVVFTLDPKDFDQRGRRSTRGDDPVEVAESNYLQITHMHEALNESFRNLRFGPGSYYQRMRERIGIRDTLDLQAYVSTVEIQKRGWPHLNAILVAPGLGKRARDLTAKLKGSGFRCKDEIGRIVATAVLGEHILEKSGFGFTWADGAHSADTVAAYVAKLSQDKPGHDAPGEKAEAERIAALKVRGITNTQAGEMAKLSQVPYDAKAHTRRIHFSRNFWGLPEVEAVYTGILLNSQGEMVQVRKKDRDPAEKLRRDLVGEQTRPPEPPKPPLSLAELLGVLARLDACREAHYQEIGLRPKPTPEELAAMIAEIQGKTPPELEMVRTGAKALLQSWGYTEQTPGRNDALREAMDHVQRVFRDAVECVVILDRFRYWECTGDEHPRSESEQFDYVVRMVPYAALEEIRVRLSDVSARRVGRRPRMTVVFGSDGERYCPETGEVFPDPRRPGPAGAARAPP